MSSIIVVFPKKEIATNIRNILVRNGFDVIGVGVTGAQAVQLADNLDDGIVVCGYKMTDMLYNELRDYLPSTIEMLLIASPEKCSDRTPGVISLSMPFKVFDLMNTNRDDGTIDWRRKKKRRAELKNRNPEQQALCKRGKESSEERNNRRRKKRIAICRNVVWRAVSIWWRQLRWYLVLWRNKGD